jgi:hypothetical protein
MFIQTGLVHYQRAGCYQRRRWLHMDSSAKPVREWSRRQVLHQLAQCALLAVTAWQRLPEARADYTPQSAKRAFERYAPRILSGRELLSALESALKAGNRDANGRWDLSNKRSDAARLLRAMRIYAGTFSNNYESPKTRELRALVDELEQSYEKARSTQDAARREQYLQAARRSYERYLDETNLSTVALQTPEPQQASE